MLGSIKMFGGPQGEALQQLYANAGNLWGDMSKQFDTAGKSAMPYIEGAASGVQNPWQNIMAGGAEGASAERVNPALERSLNESLVGQSDTARMYNDIIGGEGNSYVDPAVAGMKRGVMDNLNRYVMPDIASSAVNAGQTGSSRQGIAEGLAYSDAMKDMVDKESSMRMDAFDKDLNWKMDIANRADAGRSAAQDKAIGLMGRGDANVKSGMGYAPTMQNLGMGMYAPTMMPWQAMGQYANTVGGPTVLGSGSQSGDSKGWGMSGYGSGS